jgi:hypothetical protein
MHREKLRNASKAVDNDMPDSALHPPNKRNKEHAVEGNCCFPLTFILERCSEIEKANRLLLQKMTNILTSGPTYKPGSHENLGPLFSQATKANKRAISIPSLNRNSRQRDLEKIMFENE